jgi:tetratricopeptide (TPR) repeat protein
MDWGLAKVLHRTAPAAAEGPATEAEMVSTLRTAAGEPGSQAGAVLGTPAYMAPEQARGQVDRLDERSDVFGLGAILCEVLTGQPPYVARDSWQVRLQAARGDLADAHRRLQASGAQPELVGLTRRCLAADPAERPPDAGAVAREVSGYLASVAERLRAAEVAAARAAARAEQERKARRLTLALAVAVLGLVVLGGGGWWWWQQQQDRRQARAQAAHRHVAEALHQAAAFRQQARWADARAVLQQAADRLDEDAADELRERLAQARADLALAAKLDGIRLGRAALVEGKLVPSAAAANYARALSAQGLNVLGGDPEEVVAQIQGSAIRAHLVAALDDWALVEPKRRKLRRLLAVARRADPGRLKDQLRDLKVWDDRKRLLRLARAAQGDRLSPALSATLVGLLAKVKEDPLTLLHRAREQHPGDFWLNFTLANALSVRGQRERALGYYRVALVLRPESTIVVNNLGTALYEQGQLTEAVKAYRRAIALDPKFPLAHTNLGNAFSRQGKLPKAVKEHRRAIALDPDLALAHNNLGVALHEQGKQTEAVKAFRRALALDPELAAAHNGLGNALAKQGRLTEAVKELRRAIALDSKDPKAYYNLGLARKAQGRLAAAVQAYRSALALDPNLVHAHNGLGNALKAQGQLSEAAREYRRTLALDPKLAVAHFNLGLVLDKLGQLPAAVKEWRLAVALDPKHALAHYSLGNALARQDQLPAAVKEWRRALALDPRYAPAYASLGLALYKQGQLTEAVKELRRATALDPKDAAAHVTLGVALLQLGRFTEARRALRRCLRLLRADDPLRPLVSQQLLQCRQLVALDRKLTAVLKGEGKPEGPAEQLSLALLCQRYKQRYAAAAGFYAAAFTAQPEFAADLRSGYRSQAACCAVLAAVGQGKGAGQLSAREKAQWREQALSWLGADLELWAKQVQSAKPPDRQAAQQALTNWQQGPDLAGVREPAALAKLPKAERQEWIKVWAEVDALLKRTGGAK